MTPQQMIFRGLTMMSVALTLQGCLFGGGPLFGDEPQQGYTECGDFFADPGEDIMCQPGQYCEDPTFSECVDGCLSNENCADDQRCVKADGTQTGSCQATIKRQVSEPRGEMPDRPRGFMECGDGAAQNTCQPGQYCRNPSYGLCEAGCLSDLNCGDEQFCAKENSQDKGSCQRAE